MEKFITKKIAQLKDELAKDGAVIPADIYASMKTEIAILEKYLLDYRCFYEASSIKIQPIEPTYDYLKGFRDGINQVIKAVK